MRRQLGYQRLLLNDDQRRRLAVKAKKLGGRVLRELTTSATPESRLAWHRKLIARKHEGSRQRGPGRPRVGEETQQPVMRMATENQDWGYRRIQGALANLGHEVARGTLANMLREHGLEPDGDRAAAKHSDHRREVRSHEHSAESPTVLTVAPMVARPRI